MATTQLGRIYTPKNSAELRDRFLRDVRLAAIDSGVTDPPVHPGSDWWLLGSALGDLGLIGLANTTIGLDANSVLDATGPDLDRIRVAYGLPEVTPAPATGKLKITVLGPTSIVDGTHFLYPSGLRGKTVGAHINPADGAEIDVIAIDVGTQTNLASGTVVRFVSPPVNLATEATVSDGAPLTGGTDAETDERKRDRILNTLRNKPAGGNWGHVRQIGLEASGAVQDVYVMPALGGPGSQRVVVVKDFDTANNDFSRAPSSVVTGIVRNEIQSNLPTWADSPVQAPVNQPVSFTIKVTIPESTLSGGNGLGWLDPSPWPPLVGGDSNDVQLSATPTQANVITVDAATTTSPIAGQTHISWWSSVTRKFYSALVTGVSGSSGAWVLTLDRALVDSTGAGPVDDDYICPAAQNLEKYGVAWVDLFRELGPGENTTDTNRIPRAKRHPFVSDEDQSDVNSVFLGRLTGQFPEITSIQFGVSTTTTPTVPGTVATAPSILTPHKFAVYKL